MGPMSHLTPTSLPAAAEHRPAARGAAARDDGRAPSQCPRQDAVPLGVYADPVTAPGGHRAPCQQLEPSDAPHHAVLQQNHPETDSLTARGPGGWPTGSCGPGAQGQMDRREDWGSPGGRKKWGRRQAEPATSLEPGGGGIRSLGVPPPASHPSPPAPACGSFTSKGSMFLFHGGRPSPGPSSLPPPAPSHRMRPLQGFVQGVSSR